MILQIHTSHIKYWESNTLSKAQTPLQQVHPQHEGVGEWRRRNEKIGKYMRICTVWTFKMQLKLLN